MYHVTITGVGFAVPGRILSNHDLAQMVDTTDTWILRRTGIRERRIADETTATSDLAATAASAALVKAGLDPEQIDLVLVATSTPDQWMPSTACVVQQRLTASRAAALDINAACSGFVYAMATGAQFIKAEMYQNVLVVGADLMSRVVNWQDRSTCVLFGDGAGAVVLQRTDKPALFHSILGADGSGAALLEIPAGGSRLPATVDTVSKGLHTLRMNGAEVFRFGVEILVRSVIQGSREAGLEPEDLALIIPHQANIRMIQAAAERLGLPMARFYTNLDRHGNTSAASIPIALAEAVMQGCVNRGDILAFVGFGAGLTWGVNLVTWQGRERDLP